jgi:hypothetical protein
MGAFPPCTPCPYLYRRVYAWGGNYGNASSGLYPSDETSFAACYASAIAKVNSIDITTIPWGSVRWFDYGGESAFKSACSYIDSGNVLNNPTNLPGSGTGAAPAGTDDYGAILAGGSELSYMGLDNPIFGVNAGGYAIATFSGADGQPPHGVFAVSRIQVLLAAAKCNAKWSLVYWDTNSSPEPGFYTIQCQCDATSIPSCPACENGSTPGALCVDIPPASPFFYQADPLLPCSCQYFVPGFNCSDLT